jgi:hypothetical protein
MRRNVCDTFFLTSGFRIGLRRSIRSLAYFLFVLAMVREESSDLQSNEQIVRYFRRGLKDRLQTLQMASFGIKATVSWLPIISRNISLLEYLKYWVIRRTDQRPAVIER